MPARAYTLAAVVAPSSAASSCTIVSAFRLSPLPGMLNREQRLPTIALNDTSNIRTSWADPEPQACTAASNGNRKSIGRTMSAASTTSVVVIARNEVRQTTLHQHPNPFSSSSVPHDIAVAVIVPSQLRWYDATRVSSISKAKTIRKTTTGSCNVFSLPASNSPRSSVIVRRSLSDCFSRSRAMVAADLTATKMVMPIRPAMATSTNPIRGTAYSATTKPA